MSWHFLRGQEEASSEAISWDGHAFVPSRSKTTLGAYCLPDNATDACPVSPFGMTLRRSMGTLGAEGLTWFRGDSLVRTYLPPEKAPASEAPEADCGPSSPESLAKFNLHSYSWRTRQCSLFGGLTPFSETWPRWGMMRSGELYPLPTPALHTSENASGLLPTPVKQMELSMWKSAEYRTKKTFVWGKNTMAKRVSGAHIGVVLSWTVAEWHLRNGGVKNSELHLCPCFAEMIMGWPPSWTDTQPLATDRFQRWLDSYGRH